jgi:hypothetical protein
MPQVWLDKWCARFSRESRERDMFPSRRRYCRYSLRLYDTREIRERKRRKVRRSGNLNGLEESAVEFRPELIE